MSSMYTNYHIFSLGCTKGTCGPILDGCFCPPGDKPTGICVAES